MKTLTAIILLVPMLSLPFAARAQIVSNGNGSGGGSPIGAAGGVLGGTYPNPDFNSTNTAGNTMNNAFVVDNQSGFGSYGNDLTIRYDTSTGYAAIEMDATYPAGPQGVAIANQSDGSGSDFFIDTADLNSDVVLECNSALATGEANACYVYAGSNGQAPVFFGAEGFTNSSMNGPPAMPYGVGIAITIASGYPPCDGGENLNAPGFVVDATSCADGVQPSGGGGTHCPVFCDGVKWRALYTVAASTPLPSPTPTPTPLPTQTPTATPTP